MKIVKEFRNQHTNSYINDKKWIDSRKAYPLFILLVSSPCWLFLTSCDQTSVEQLPNVILILADDLGYADLGFTGCQDFETPSIDKLATGGVIFSNGYASHSFCAPTRAGILTGRNQHRFGFQENPSPRFDDHGLPSDQQILPQLLSKGGYQSALVGKWHLGVKEDHHPLNRGFDEFYGFLSGGHDYFSAEETDLNKHSYLQPLEHDSLLIGVKGYLTDQLSAFGVDFIHRNESNPFFLFMSYNAPHAPFQAPDTYLDRVDHIRDSTRRIYAAMVTAVDDGVGKIMKALEASGIEENTLVIFMSDNGGAPVAPALNTPFRGMKGTLLEGGIHVPYVFYWKGKLNHQMYSKPVVSYDVFATALELAGVDIPNDRVIDSRNLIPYLTGKKEGAPHELIYWKHADYQWTVRSKNRKALFVKNRLPYLFDMKVDLSETTDKSAEEVEVLADLMEQYARWNNEMPQAKYESTGIAFEKQSKALDALEETR